MKTVESLDFDRLVLLKLVSLPIRFRKAVIVSMKHMAAVGNRQKEELTLANNRLAQFDYNLEVAIPIAVNRVH